MAIEPKFRLSAALRVTFLLFLVLAHTSYGRDASIQIGSVALSPDGKFIAVDVKEGSMSFIYKVAADSGIATRLTNATTGKETSPAFSPDGKRIAYVYWPGKGARYRIVMVDVDGLNPRQWSLSAVTDSSSDNLEPTLQHKIYGFAVCDVLLVQDTSPESMLVVRIENGHGFLHDDGPMVEFFIHKMYCAT